MAVEVAQRVLETPQMAGLELFLLRAHARRKFLEIRLDQVCADLPRLSMGVSHEKGRVERLSVVGHTCHALLASC